MFKKLKTNIKALANLGVSFVEENLQGESGELKKLAAVEFVVRTMPTPPVLKPVLRFLLGAFIDESIEYAVKKLKAA